MEELRSGSRFRQKNPKKFKYGTWGQHSGAHLALEAIGREKSIEWDHVPFKGESPVVMALLGKHLEVGAITEGSITHVKAGKLRILLMLQSYHSPNFPGIPCLKDLGDNVQDIVYSENGHDIVNSKRWGYVFCDAVTCVISLAVDTCILRSGSYPGKALAFVL